MNQQNIRALMNHDTLLNEKGSELHACIRQRLTIAFHAVDKRKKELGSVKARYTEITRNAKKWAVQTADPFVICRIVHQRPGLNHFQYSFLFISESLAERA